MNKTINNLKTVWAQLDKASGELYNALDNLSRMSGLPEEVTKAMERVDVEVFTSIKNEIEALIEDKGADVSDVAVISKEIIKKPNGNEYIVGSYRIWKNPRGGIGIKFDGEPELYNIPKGSDLYHRIEKRFNVSDIKGHNPRDLRKDIDQLKETLKFYAEDSNWWEYPVPGGYASAISADKGKRARDQLSKNN